MTLMLALVGLLAVWVVTGLQTTNSQLATAASSGPRQPNGGPQLVKMEPLPPMEGEMCEWVPASASSTLAASLFQQGGGGAPGSAAALRGRGYCEQ
jgi:hypothetical protein